MNDDVVRLKIRRPWLSFLLSILVPGLGHFYNGQPLAALALYGSVVFLIIIAKLLLFGSMIGFLAFLAIALVVRLGIAIDAWRRAASTGELALRWYNSILIYAVVVAAAASGPWIFFPQMTDPITRFQTFKIPSRGMEPTLEVGDGIMVDKWMYRDRLPERGDMIVFLFPPDPRRKFMKRCVAVGGDTVEIRDKQLFLNGEPQTEEYVQFLDPIVHAREARGSDAKRDQFGPYEVPVDSCFCLGDNRDHSSDSRFWGVVNKTLLRGKALYYYWSKDKKKLGKDVK